jgi:hypothetical protein
VTVTNLQRSIRNPHFWTSVGAMLCAWAVPLGLDAHRANLVVGAAVSVLCAADAVLLAKRGSRWADVFGSPHFWTSLGNALGVWMVQLFGMQPDDAAAWVRAITTCATGADGLLALPPIDGNAQVPYVTIDPGFPSLTNVDRPASIDPPDAYWASPAAVPHPQVDRFGNPLPAQPVPPPPPPPSK